MKTTLKKSLCSIVIATLYLVVITSSIIGCDPQKTSLINENEALQGTKWKLNEVSIAKNYQQPEIIDYSEKNIIYEFQGNNKLVITGNTDDLFIFDDCKAGEHFYEYRELNMCPTCLPGPNLVIDNPSMGQAERRYFCEINKGTMQIGNDGGVIDGNFFKWSKTFIKLN